MNAHGRRDFPALAGNERMRGQYLEGLAQPRMIARGLASAEQVDTFDVDTV